MKHLPWPKVSNFHNLRRARKKADQDANIEYRFKTKLHGTNAAVGRDADGKLYTQSRSRILSLGSDNMGFDSFVQEHAELFENLRDGSTVFGEWCGPGIQNGMASCKVPLKFFAVFGLVNERGYLLSCPAKLRYIFRETDRLKVIDWVGGISMLSFNSEESNAETLEYINQMVLNIEAKDPFMVDRFGVEGMGEGVVAFPNRGNGMLLETFSSQAFKAKGELHRSVKSNKAAQNDPEKVKNMTELAELCVTDARVEQGIAEGGGNLDMSGIKDFIDWVINDCVAECKAEIELSGLTDKQARKAIGRSAASKFKQAAGV